MTVDRRQFVLASGKYLIMTGAATRAFKHVLAETPERAPEYSIFDHWWAMAIDVDLCIGCGGCVRACKKENGVSLEPFYFRTWVERYHVPDGDIEHPMVDSPNGGYGGFPARYREGDGSKNFFVPKLCNHCAHSPCVQVCPVGATFESPDGVVLVDKDYCLGCRYCVQACPYGCRYIDPKTHSVDKCSLCYHRITKGLTTACCEVCPTGARMLGDLKDPSDPIHEFLQTNMVQVLKPQMATGAKVYYAALDGVGEVGIEMDTLLAMVEGFMYPNEIELQWSVLIVLYPYITGLVAGAFILASLERVFNVEAVKPTYRLSLLTAFAFLIVAPLPLQLHLGHPERSFQMYLTPKTDSAMAMFGFVYLWYLMGVLLLEIWLDYRRDIVLKARSSTGFVRDFYRVLALGSDNISARSLEIDERLGRFVTIIGIPSAFLLHGYVGFIFGSIKANPWWSTPLMPVVFIFSAMVSGIALVMLLYMVVSWLRNKEIDMACLDTIARYLLYAFIIDFSLEMLDLIHRMYEADESFKSLDFMVKTRLFTSQILMQIIFGTLLPLGLLVLTQITRLTVAARKNLYAIAGVLTLIGIFAMRWNVVIGGQLFSKSFLGYTVYKMDFATREGLLPAIILMVAPFFILWGLILILPPWWGEEEEASTSLPSR